MPARWARRASRAERLVGHGRDHAVLLCAMLRQQGRPARVRAGFSAYLSAAITLDHWVTEVWDAEAGRWRLVDAQIDDLQRKAHQITADTFDLSPDQFYTAARAWSLCRARKAKSGNFGVNRKKRGWNFMKNQLLLDLAALNKMELLPDEHWWDISNRDFELLDAGERKLLDEIAAQINGRSRPRRMDDKFQRGDHPVRQRSAPGERGPLAAEAAGPGGRERASRPDRAGEGRARRTRRGGPDPAALRPRAPGGLEPCPGRQGRQRQCAERRPTRVPTNGSRTAAGDPT